MLAVFTTAAFAAQGTVADSPDPARWMTFGQRREETTTLLLPVRGDELRSRGYSGRQR